MELVNDVLRLCELIAKTETALLFPTRSSCVVYSLLSLRTDFSFIDSLLLPSPSVFPVFFSVEYSFVEWVDGVLRLCELIAKSGDDTSESVLQNAVGLLG